MNPAAGEIRRVSRWICPHCDARQCAHPKWVSDKHDPHYGHAMCWLECGHLASGDRRHFERTGRTHMRCLTCVPGHWIVHVNEVALMRRASRRARASKPKRKAAGHLSMFGG